MFPAKLVVYLNEKGVRFDAIQEALSKDDLDRFNLVFPNLKEVTCLSELYASAQMFHAEKIMTFIASKSIMVKDGRHFVSLTRIVADYVQEFLGDLAGFAVDDLTEVSYPELQHLLFDLQQLKNEDSYDDDETLNPVWTYIKPLKTFYMMIYLANGKELDQKLSKTEMEQKYYDRLRVEVLGLEPLLK
jgi:hypothetical protein